jgi:AcrR family transcriptional regulator
MTPAPKMKRRLNGDGALSRTLILDTTERLMLEEGYAAISTRRVASEAGLKPPLVHYYYRTTDDLLLAAYARTAEQTFERLNRVLVADDPLKALWALSTDPTRTTLAVEFMALANHRKVIRTEIARNIKRFRRVQAELLTRLLDPDTVDPKIAPPVGVSMIMAGISRGLVMESALGVSLGHAEAERFVHWWMQHVRASRRRHQRSLQIA